MQPVQLGDDASPALCPVWLEHEYAPSGKSGGRQNQIRGVKRPAAADRTSRFALANLPQIIDMRRSGRWRVQFAPLADRGRTPARESGSYTRQGAGPRRYRLHKAEFSNRGRVPAMACVPRKSPETIPSSSTLIFAPVKKDKTSSLRAHTLMSIPPPLSESVCAQRASLSCVVVDFELPRMAFRRRDPGRSWCAVGDRIQASVRQPSHELPDPRARLPLFSRFCGVAAEGAADAPSAPSASTASIGQQSGSPPSWIAPCRFKSNCAGPGLRATSAHSSPPVRSASRAIPAESR